MADASHPWSFPILVSQLPEAGLHQVLETTPRSAACWPPRQASPRCCKPRQAWTLPPKPEVACMSQGRFGRGWSRPVVSLDPVENDVEELIDVTFAPPDQISAMPKSVQKEQGDDAEIPDLPEPIVNGAIDLGKLATEFLVLGIDPYHASQGLLLQRRRRRRTRRASVRGAEGA
jgi:hypothetical protein